MKNKTLLSLTFLLFLLPTLQAQDSFKDEIKRFQNDTIRGVLKNGKPHSGTFVFKEDIFEFNKVLEKGFDPAVGRFVGELVFPNGYYRKEIDIHYVTTVVEYVDGKPLGRIKFYTKRSWRSRWTLLFESNIRDGQLEGDYTAYYGYQKYDILQPFAKLSYREGKKEGPAVFYSRDGLVYRKAFYKNDLPFLGHFNQSHLEFEKYKEGKKVLQVQRIVPLDEDYSPSSLDDEAPKHPSKMYDSFNWRFVHLVEGSYRDGKAWTGQFFDVAASRLETFEEGTLVQQILIKKSGWSCIEYNFDKDGQLSTQRFYTNPNTINFQNDSLLYQGIYANGKKQTGDFFEIDEQLPKLLLHSRYAAGVLQTQSFLEYKKYWNPSDEKERFGIYENGKIKNGMEIEPVHGLVFQKVFEEGRLQHTSVVAKHLFPEQRYVMKMQATENGYSALDDKGTLFSEMTYTSADSTAGSISYFDEGKEVGKLAFENNKITNGDCVFPVPGFKKEKDQKTVIKITDGRRDYKQLMRDFEYHIIDTLNPEIPIAFYAFRSPGSVPANRIDIYWAGTSERISSVYFKANSVEIDAGIMVMTGWGDRAFLIDVFENGMQVESLSVSDKEELEKELKRLSSFK